MAVALRANVQFRSIVTSVDRGGPRPVRKTGETERKENEVPASPPVYGEIFAIRQNKKKKTDPYLYIKNTLLERCTYCTTR